MEFIKQAEKLDHWTRYFSPCGRYEIRTKRVSATQRKKARTLTAVIGPEGVMPTPDLNGYRAALKWLNQWLG